MHRLRFVIIKHIPMHGPCNIALTLSTNVYICTSAVVKNDMLKVFFFFFFFFFFCFFFVFLFFFFDWQYYNFTFRKLAHRNFFSCKHWKLLKNDIFNIFAQSIDCGTYNL